MVVKINNLRMEIIERNRYKNEKNAIISSFFYILDQGYHQCKEDDLGGFLGAISPELWGDGQPIDRAIFNDWQRISNPNTIDLNNIIGRAYDFLEVYEKEFRFSFSKTKQWLLTTANKEIIQKAYDKSKIMYQKFNYDN